MQTLFERVSWALREESQYAPNPICVILKTARSCTHRHNSPDEPHLHWFKSLFCVLGQGPAFTSVQTNGPYVCPHNIDHCLPAYVTVGKNAFHVGKSCLRLTYSLLDFCVTLAIRGDSTAKVFKGAYLSDSLSFTGYVALWYSNFFEITMHSVFLH